MLNQLLLFVLSSLGLASCVIWANIAVRISDRQPVLPLVPREAVAWPPFVILLALIAWIMVPTTLALAMRGYWAPSLPEATQQSDTSSESPADPETEGEASPVDQKQDVISAVRGVQISCVSNLLILLLVLRVLSASDRGSLTRFGIPASSWKKAVTTGILGFVASIVPVIIVLLATSPFRSTETQHVFLRILADAPDAQTLIWIWMAVVVMAPLAEELIFRVVLQGWLQTNVHPRTAIILVAAFFSIVHGWPDALPLFPLAIILGYVFYRQYNYWAVVTIHALFNGANLSLALLQQSMQAAS